LGSEADAAAGAPQGWHDVQTLLAQKGAAELLATYLERIDNFADKASRASAQNEAS
jgi:hypothetical protein